MDDKKDRREEDRIYVISSVPSLIFCVIISLLYSYRLKEIYPAGSRFDPILWDMITYFLTPIITVAPLLFFLAFEILCWQKNEGQSGFHVKRLAGRVIVQLMAVAIFLCIYLVLLTFLLPLTSPAVALVSISLVWASLFFAVMKTFRRHFLRFERGE